MAHAQGQIRYGVVGAGWIAQAAFMPGVGQTGNSRMTALVSGSPEKTAALGARYGLDTYAYEDFDTLLASGTIDALYIATPNDRHREFAEPALKAGIHVLLEKPMATTIADAEAIEAAAKASGAKLMVAYRLHCEPGTLAMMEAVRRGDIGRPRYFTATFSQRVDPNNYRAKSGYWGGPVPDMGVYAINAVRNFFEAEPIKVGALAVRTPDRDLGCDDTVSVMLGFSEGRSASFTVSYSAESIDRFHVVGSHGIIEAFPGFGFGEGTAIDYRLIRDGETRTVAAPVVDQFGGETDYFSDCILNDRAPEPDGEEGLLDMRVLAAIERAIESGTVQTLEPVTRSRRIDATQARRLPLADSPDMIGGKPPVE